MDIENTLELLKDKIEKMFSSDSTGHDIDHLLRTLNNAKNIQKKEGGDKEIIYTAALLHDIHRISEKETGKYCLPKDSLPIIKKILKEINFPQEKIEKVLHCIEFHEEYSFCSTGKTVKDIETLILQDADNLDAIGAVGIGRTFAFGGFYGRPLWIPGEPLEDQKIFNESDENTSSIRHFYTKLLKLKDNMNTKTGKKLAQSRHNFLKIFLKQFFKEWPKGL